MICTGFCIACKQLFAFNPERVPSVLIDGEREPLCAACMEKINSRRAGLGLPPFLTVPGAYDPEECV